MPFRLRGTLRERRWHRPMAARHSFANRSSELRTCVGGWGVKIGLRVAHSGCEHGVWGIRQDLGPIQSLEGGCKLEPEPPEALPKTPGPETLKAPRSKSLSFQAPTALKSPTTRHQASSLPPLAQATPSGNFLPDVMLPGCKPSFPQESPNIFVVTLRGLECLDTGASKSKSKDRSIAAPPKLEA